MAAPSEVVGTDMREAQGHVAGVDLTDEAQVQSALFEAAGPIHGVIHTAAYGGGQGRGGAGGPGRER